MRSQAYATSEMQPRLSNDQVVNPLDADPTVCRSQQREQLNPSQQQAEQLQQQLQSSGQQLGQQIQQLRHQQANALSPQQQPILHDMHQSVFLESCVDSSDHCGAQGLDAREAVWKKVHVLKDKYLQDMKELYSMLTTRSTLPMPPEQLQNLKHYKDVLHRMIPYLTVPKEKLPEEFNLDRVEAFEKQIVNIMEIFKRRRPTLSQEPTVQPQL